MTVPFLWSFQNRLLSDVGEVIDDRKNAAGATADRRRQDSLLCRTDQGTQSNQPWTWHSMTFVSSMAWLGRSRTLARILDHLEIEHMNHDGETGRPLFTD